MSGIWADDGRGRWRPMPAGRFADENELHDLVEQNPQMLPIAGRPALAILGREVRCGTGYADLVAIETATGRPVVIEIKLATNTDRRQVLTQVLGYAAYLRRLNVDGFADLLRPHLDKAGQSSLTAAAAGQDPGLDEVALAQGLAECLRDGQLRCIIVVDQAPPDVVELVGYLQEVSNDRLALDLVTVTAYDIAGSRVLVPQLVEPDQSQITTTLRHSEQARVVAGSEPFEAAIAEAPELVKTNLEHLLAWARGLEADGLAVLYSTIGKGRGVLNLRIPGQERSMLVIWNENGPSLSPFRTVIEQEAPDTLAILDQRLAGQIRQGNYIQADYDDDLLELLRTAYVESRARHG